MNMGNLQSRIEGKKNPIWNMITSVMSSLYELERENILERTQSGRIQNGGILGRKIGTTENRNDFLQKEKTKKYFRYLKKANL